MLSHNQEKEHFLSANNRNPIPEEVLDLVYTCGKMSKNIYEKLPSKDDRFVIGEREWKVIHRIDPVEDIGARTTYRGAAYFCKDSGHLIIAHRGTDNIADWIDSNLHLWPLFSKSKLTEFFEENIVPFSHQATSKANKIMKKENPSKEITVIHTGHSLGGAYAAMLGYKDICRSISFDSPGIGDLLDELDDPYIDESDGPFFIDRGYLRKQPLHFNFVSGPNLVNTTGKRYGHWIRIFSQHVENNPNAKYQTALQSIAIMTSLIYCSFTPAVVLSLGSVYLNSSNFYDLISHSMDNIVKTMDDQQGLYFFSTIQSWPNRSDYLLLRSTNMMSCYLNNIRTNPKEYNIKLEELFKPYTSPFLYIRRPANCEDMFKRLGFFFSGDQLSRMKKEIENLKEGQLGFIGTNLSHEKSKEINSLGFDIDTTFDNSFFIEIVKELFRIDHPILKKWGIDDRNIFKVKGFLEKTIGIKEIDLQKEEDYWKCMKLLSKELNFTFKMDYISETIPGLCITRSSKFQESPENKNICLYCIEFLDKSKYFTSVKDEKNEDSNQDGYEWGKIEERLEKLSSSSDSEDRYSGSISSSSSSSLSLPKAGLFKSASKRKSEIREDTSKGEEAEKTAENNSFR